MVTSLSLEVCRQKRMTACLWNECLSGVLSRGWAGVREALHSDYWEVTDNI